MNRDKSLVSIIMPVYNVASFVGTSINSVLNQSYENWELIIVDDGSTDDSFQICSTLAKSDHRIKLLQQKNSGVSSARNRGLKEANGDFILFLDSDDELYPQTIKHCIESLLSYDDVVQFSYESINESGESLQTYSLKEGSYSSINDYHRSANYPYTIWGFLIPRVLIAHEGIYFSDELSYGEDQEFIIRVLLSANRILVLPEALYRYRLRSDSVMQSIKSFQQAEQHLKLADKIIEQTFTSQDNEAFIERRLISFIRRYLIISSLLDRDEVSISLVIAKLKQSQFYKQRSCFKSRSLRLMLYNPLLALAAITYLRNCLELIGSKYARKLH